MARGSLASPEVILHRLAAIVALALALPAAAGASAAGAPPLPSYRDEVTVTASRTPRRLAETPGSAVVVSGLDLRASGAVALDDALRQVPGFTLFRRTGSRAANPTAQGVSLRGLGASGASRAAVLADGAPLADPFGGWVSWGRVPRLAIERVEIARGGGSDVWGCGALGGVVQIVRRRPGAERLALEASAGELATADAALVAGVRRGGEGAGGWGASLAAEGLTTDGYYLLDDADRGAVDTRVAMRSTSVEASVARDLAAIAGGSVFARVSAYREARDNGTRLQDNRTRLASLAAGLDAPAAGGTLSLRLDGTGERYEQSFSAVAPGRASERLTREQEVPSSTVGGSAGWIRGLGETHRLLAGIEGRRTDGESREAAPGGPLAVAGGTQDATGAWVEDLWQATPRLSLTAALRWDGWRNDPGPQPGAARRAEAWSPRLAVLFAATPDLVLTASAYRAFRAPTLNELYRGFRVGDVLTLANADLAPERLAGIEAGLRWTSDAATARLTLFSSTVEDPVANVTLSTSPDLVRRQRRNLGRVRARGAELEGERRIAGWTLEAAYLFTDSTVRSFAADPSLVGLRVPQVPRHQASLGIRREGARWRGGLQGRWVGAQPEDDRNTLRLASALTFDGRLETTLGAPRGGVALFAAGENLLDRRVEVGRTPLPTWGSPRLLRLGIRVELR